MVLLESWNEIPKPIKENTFFIFKKELKINLLSLYAKPHGIITILTIPPNNHFFKFIILNLLNWELTDIVKFLQK